MNVREKLVELLRNSPHLDTIKGYKGNDCTFEQGADWLIANGVTVQLDNEPLLRGEKCDEKCVEHCLEWLKQSAEERYK